MKARRTPVVRARRVQVRDNDLLIVSCCYCDREHTHGAGGIGSPFGAGDGERVAHCGRGEYRVVEVATQQRIRAA